MRQDLGQFSPLLDRAVRALGGLPGVGSKSALRLALFLLREDKSFTHGLTDDLRDFVDGIHYCSECHNICDEELGAICSDPQRDSRLVCVVESVREVLAIEQTGRYHGRYHVLGGLISPIDGIGPDDLFLADLPQRVQDEGVREILLALSTTMEGDTTNFYIYRLLKDIPDLSISTLSRGVSVGDDLEYADQLTLGRSIENRIPFSSTLRE